MNESALLTSRYKPLSKTEEYLCAKELSDALEDYERYIFKSVPVVSLLFSTLKEEALSRSLRGVSYSLQHQAATVTAIARGYLEEAEQQFTAGILPVEAMLKVNIKPTILLVPKIQQLAGPEAVELAKRVADIQSKFVMALLHMIYKSAYLHHRRLAGDGIEFSDLFNEGVKASLEASFNFEGDRGVRWVAFAGTCVRGAIKKFIIEKTRMVATPRQLLDRWTKVKHILSLDEDEREVALEKLNATFTTGTPYTLHELRKISEAVSTRVFSATFAHVNNEPHDDSDFILEGRLISDAPSPDTTSLKNRVIDALNTIPCLTMEERMVLQSYTLGAGDSLNGVVLSTSAMKIQNSAIKKLRREKPELLRRLLDELE